MEITCIVSALLFWIGNLLKIVYLYKERSRGAMNWFYLKELEPSYIQDEWNFRIANKPHQIATGVMSSLAWFVFCFPMLQLVYVLNQNSKGISRSLWLHSGIAILVLGGAFTEWISYFVYMGVTLACEFMVKDFNLQNWTDQGNDNIGYRSMEVTFFAIRGINFWVDAFEWMALFFIMVFVFVSIRRYQMTNPGHFGVWWNAMGLSIGILSLLDFVTEILRVVNFRVFSQIAFWYGATNRLILLPAWLILLGWRLPYALLDLETKLNEKPVPEQPASHDLQVSSIEDL